MAAEYRIILDKPKEFEKCRIGHQPFHWFAEFYGIMRNGGFDVTIGNPPYVELRAVTKYRARNFSREGLRNLYAIAVVSQRQVTEKSQQPLAFRCESVEGFAVLEKRSPHATG